MSALGRPTLYDPAKHPALAESFCLLGATNQQLADLFEVSISSIEEWMREYEAFSRAIKDGREVADARVATSLYRKALGGSEVACIFWLKNRQRARWKDKQDHTVEGEVRTGPIDPEKLKQASQADLEMAREVIKKFTGFEGDEK
jgi:transposase